MSERPHHNHGWMPVMYANYYGILKQVAFEHGYALAVHGTMGRDLDLIAFPWVDDPKPHLEMLAAFRKALGTHRVDGVPYDSMESKPCGRFGYTISSGGGGYLDISVFDKSDFLISKLPEEGFILLQSNLIAMEREKLGRYIRRVMPGLRVLILDKRHDSLRGTARNIFGLWGIAIRETILQFGNMIEWLRSRLW